MVTNSKKWTDKFIKNVWMIFNHKKIIAELDQKITEYKNKIVELNETVSNQQDMVVELQKTISAQNHQLENGIAGLKTVPSELTSQEKKIEGIIFNTLPKSGSVFISRTLALSLGIEFRTQAIAHGFFPNYFLIPNQLERIKHGNAIRQEHFDANPVNLRLLRECTDRLIINLRDPRQATLSWLHHCNKLRTIHKNGVNYTVHNEPEGYDEWTLQKQLDWHIEAHLASSANWIRGWLKEKNNPDLKIHFSTFENFVNNPVEYFETIVDFLDIPHSLFKLTLAEKTTDNNFRLGKTDEWNTVYSEDQKKRAVELIGMDILETFGWNTGS